VGKRHEDLVHDICVSEMDNDIGARVHGDVLLDCDSFGFVAVGKITPIKAPGTGFD